MTNFEPEKTILVKKKWICLKFDLDILYRLKLNLIVLISKFIVYVITISNIIFYLLFKFLKLAILKKNLVL